MFTKKELKALLIVTLLLGVICFLVIYPYSYNFNKYDFSDKPSDWGSYGDYIGGILNSIFTFVNILILIFLTLYIREKDDTYKDYKQLKIEIEVIDFSHDKINIAYLKQVNKQVRMLTSYDMLFKSNSLRESYLKGINGSIEVLKTIESIIENSSKEPRIEKVIKKIEKKISKLQESEKKEQLLNELNNAKDLHRKVLSENEKMQQLNELLNHQLEMVGFLFEFLMIQKQDDKVINTFKKDQDKRITEILNKIRIM
jgi:flagellar motility protein MotE (MotC chaperone)